MTAVLVALLVTGCAAGGTDPSETSEVRAGTVPDVPGSEARKPIPPVRASDPTPTLTPTPTADAVLETLRGSERYLELAEHERAAGARWARFGYELFAPLEGRTKLFEWTNKAELWDAVAPAFRDGCLRAGPEATRPMWDTEVLMPAGVQPRWHDHATGGRGQFVELVCLYHDEAADELVERWGAVLIATDGTLAGAVVAQMPPFEVREAQHPSFAAARDATRARLWAWVEEQPVIDAGQESR